MPSVKRPAALAAAYQATKRKIRDLPTLMLQGNQTIFRSFNPTGKYTYLAKPAAGGHVSKPMANLLLVPGDGVLDLNNRFSGPAHNPSIPPVGALYCVLQQQALINEVTHYSGKAPAWALSGKAVLKMYLMGSMLVAELSPHNPRSMRFFRELGPKTWDEMNDPDDCSVARGIALAIAETGFIRGIAVQTVRQSERSDEERGDNLVLFANPKQMVQGISIREVAFHGKVSTPEVFPVEFP